MEIRGYSKGGFHSTKSALFLLALSSFIFIFSFQSVSADVISLNSGGSTEIAVTADKYIEGFFSGIPEEAVVTPPIVPPGGGGGGGGGGGTIPSTSITVTPSWNTNLGIRLAVGTTSLPDETINVTNFGAAPVTVTLTHTFENHLQIIGNDTLTIPSGENKNFKVRFIAGSTPDTITGIIRISDKTVLTSLDISTQLLLFDSNIVVLNPKLEVTQGGELKTLVTLIPMGDPARLDVTLNFIIKDYTNKVYLTKSETLLVSNLTELRRNFDVGLLAPGNYVIGLQLVYPNGVAPSSAHFRVVEKPAMGFFGKVILFLIMMILIVAIFILIILIWRRRKKKDEEEKGVQGKIYK